MTLCLLLVPKLSYGAIAAVGGQNKGEESTASGGLGTLAFAGNVTTGNTIIIAIAVLGTAAPNITAPTKSAGTATLGTITSDTSYSNEDVPSTTYFEISVYHAYVTAGGSCTITINGTYNGGGVAMIDEFSGMATSSPVNGTPVSNNGTNAIENPGAISTNNGGMALMVSTDYSSGNGSYTQTNTNIYKIATGASTNTGEGQYDLTAAGGSQTVTATVGGGMSISYWIAAGVAYNQASASTSNIYINNAQINNAKLGF